MAEPRQHHNNHEKQLQVAIRRPKSNAFGDLIE